MRLRHNDPISAPPEGQMPFRAAPGALQRLPIARAMGWALRFASPPEKGSA
ncbi:MAG: hypothetical protein LBV61_00135 [Burkholderiaceae bacterium]|nr:hypothetical protein [Burkholderiaceae bacterium]